jgi:2-octaprenyl-6-methoxyphenol hydroxylase
MHYDLIIVGGGLVGKSIACALRHSTLKIALIDAKKEDALDPRLIALNQASVAFFKELELWPQLLKHAAPINDIHISRRGHFGVTRLNTQSLDYEALGYVVPARFINEALSQALGASSHTELRPVVLKALVQTPEAVELTLEPNPICDQLRASLILAADGTHSFVRQHLNFEVESAEYHQTALVTETYLGRAHSHRAYERFLEDGALAMLPLQDKRYATIWTASSERIAALMQLSDVAFLETLQQQFGYRLGALQKTGTRYTYPLHFMHVKNPIQDRVVLVGNAAQTLHPLAAQGLNLALDGVARLTRQIRMNVERHSPLQSCLEAPVPAGGKKMNLYFSHYLNQIFSTKVPGGNLARQLGMVGLDLCDPLKKQLTLLLAS